MRITEPGLYKDAAGRKIEIVGKVNQDRHWVGYEPSIGAHLYTHGGGSHVSKSLDIIDRWPDPIAEMIASLEKAITDAGGTRGYDFWKQMTVPELIKHLAPNGIRFCHGC